MMRESIRRAAAAAVLLLAAAPALGAQQGRRPIEVSGFLVEEAYNQEKGLLQQIGTFTRPRGGETWSMNYEQEWPLGSERHELDLGLPVSHEPGATRVDAIEVGYRYGWVGDEHSRLAVTPTLEAELPVRRGDGTQVELRLPVSAALGGHVTTNTNVGVQYDTDGHEASLLLGQGVFWRATPMLNLVLEGTWSRGESVLGDLDLTGARRTVLAPGVQYAFDVGRVQIVPGVAVPFTPAETRNRAVLVYFSVEHPFTRGADDDN